MAGGEFDDLVLIHAQHHAAHRPGATALYRWTMARWRALQRFQGARGSGARAPASAPGSSHRRGCRSSSMSLRTKVELDLRRGRKADFDFSLKPIVTSGLEHPQLAGDVHRLDQRLVAVPQVRADSQIGACVSTASGQVRSASRRVRKQGICWRVAFNMVISLLRWLQSNQQPQKQKRPVAGANGPLDQDVRVRYRLRPLADS